VRHADRQQPGGLFAAEQFGDGTGQATGLVVLFDSDDRTGARCRSTDEFGVQVRGRRHPDQIDRDIGRGELLDRGDGLHRFVARGDDGDIRAVTQVAALADLDGFLGEQIRQALGADPHVGRSDVVEHRGHAAADLTGIAGGEDHQAGDHAHDGVILEGVVGSPQIRIGESAVASDDLGVLAHVAQVVAHHFVAARRHERGDGGEDGNQSRGGQTGGDTGDALLHDAEFEVALGIGLGEIAEARTLAGVCRQHHDAVVVRGNGGHRASEFLAGVGQLTHRVTFCSHSAIFASSSVIACSSSPSAGFQ